MSLPPLIDTHCHLDDPRFVEDFDAVLQRAREVGVAHIVTIGCASSVENADQALGVARQHADWMSATVGVHPHDALHTDTALLERVASIAQDPQIVAVGETGLDFYYDNSPREQQQTSFREHIAIAKTVGKPIVVHTRDAAVETLQILREENAADVGGIIHCFSEDATFAKQALDLGFVSSFSGIVTFKKSHAIQEAAKTQPIDAILVETDAPYLAPVPRRGKRNEPAYVSHTASFIADLRGISEEELRAATTANAQRLLGIPDFSPKDHAPAA